MRNANAINRTIQTARNCEINLHFCIPFDGSGSRWMVLQLLLDPVNLLERFGILNCGLIAPKFSGIE